MKLTLEKGDLVRAITVVERVVDSRANAPIMSNIRLEASGGMLSVTGTNLDICASNAAHADVEVDGATTAPGATLKAIVSKLPDGSQVSMETPNESTMVIRAGRSRYTLQTLPASDFPDFSASAEGTSFAMPAATLDRMLEATEFAISKEETRYYLCGAYLHTVVRDGQTLLCIAATDGVRLSQITAPLPTGVEQLAGAIIPERTVAELRNLAKDASGDVYIDVSSVAIRVRAGSIDILSKLIDGQYPEYQRLLPHGNQIIATFDRDDLAGGVQRASTVMAKKTNAVRIDIRPGEMELTSRNEGDQAIEVVDADYDGDPAHVGFNANYLERALHAMGSGEMQLCLDSPTSPTLLRRPDAPEHVIVLMPMRA